MIPNFFIVGAPKSGTTALVSYLASHPQVFLSEPKEPHFFADDFPHYKELIPDMGSYLNLFNDAVDTRITCVGEASVWYLYSRTAIANIKKHNPSAKLIVMLRKPQDVIHSLHKQLLWTLDEDDEDLDSALNKMSARAEGDCLPQRCREPKFLLYKEVVKFGEQLERLYEYFPREQVHIIFFEDFVENTSACYGKVLSFLSVDNDGRVEFEKVNERKENRSNFIAGLTHRLPNWLVLMVVFFKKILCIKSLGLRKRIIRFNSKPIKKSSGSISDYDDLNRDLEKLKDLTGRELRGWGK